MEHIYITCSLDTTLQIMYICSIKIINIFKEINLSSHSVAASKFRALIPSDNILQRRTDDKVLLLETQLFPLEEIIVRVQHLRNILGNVPVENGLN